jgi:hypothetical protein
METEKTVVKKTSASPRITSKKQRAIKSCGRSKRELEINRNYDSQKS